MGLFDFLIDQNTTAPSTGEYIYLMHMIWKEGSLDSYPMKEGEIMCDVEKLPNGSFAMTHKATGERYCTTYAWSLAENTPENRKRIQHYNELLKTFIEMSEDVAKLKAKIKTLQA